MQKLLKIDNIMYFVNDLEKAANFYESALGLIRAWTDTERKMIGFVFEQSDSEIVLQSFDPTIKFDYSFLVENVVNFCLQFKKMGYQILEEPFDVRPGKFAVLADQDGNAIPIIDLSKFDGKPMYDNKLS